MLLAADPPSARQGLPVLTALLPGSDRKRRHAAYCYRLGYRNPVADAVGCVLIWEVSGGRLPYQIALERDEHGSLRVHCTCADAIFRCEAEGRFCKHVHGLLQFFRAEGIAAQPAEPYGVLGA
jgi:hypothetical protein